MWINHFNRKSSKYFIHPACCFVGECNSEQLSFFYSSFLNSTGCNLLYKFPKISLLIMVCASMTLWDSMVDAGKMYQKDVPVLVDVKVVIHQSR